MNIAIFASGGGSNAEVIIQKLPSLLKEKNVKADIKLILTNNVNAGVLNIAKLNNISSVIVNLKDKSAAVINSIYLNELNKFSIDFIILAGYLKKIPLAVIKAYPQKIINIHPALLPAYGGAGMYGKFVHEAVVKAGEKRSGISIHYVDEVYDNGTIAFQTFCDIGEDETGETLAKKVLALEHKWYSIILSDIIFSQNHVK